MTESSTIMLIIGFTTIFTWVLTMQKVPQTVGAFFMSLNMPAWAIALIFDVLILMIGTFIDVSPAILLLTPILLPVMVQYGFSPLQFGAMMITGLAIGLVTPPVGMCLNACNKINRMPIIEIFKGAAPYVIHRPAAAAGLQHLLSSIRIPLIKTGSAPLRGAVCFLYANRRNRCIWPTDMVH